jgi:hypothetical protein
LQTSRKKIWYVLDACGANKSFRHRDYFKEKGTVQDRQDAKYILEIMKDISQNLCIGSVLITTVTFGATFAMPGGNKADDHRNGGTPTLAGRYTFDAFTLANALAFTLSTMAIISLMISGSPLHDLKSRVKHLQAAHYLLNISVTSLVVAFAIGTYMLLAPVAHKIAVAVCVLSSLVLLYQNLEFIIKEILMVVPSFVRRGVVFTCMLFVRDIGFTIIGEYWPIIVIFCSTVRNYPAEKVEQPVQPPTMSP